MLEKKILGLIVSQKADDNYPIPKGYLTKDIYPILLKNLAASDAKIRVPSYEILNAWIWDDDGIKFTNTQLKEVADTLADNLYIGLGKKNSESVFIRAWSSLILGDIIGLDSKRNFFSKSEIASYCKKVTDYYKQENDFRGFISKEKDWAHALAHATDCFAYLAKHPKTSKEDLLLILNAISTKLKSSGQSIFLYDEEKRMANTVIVILTGEILNEEVIVDWLEHLTQAPNFDTDNLDQSQLNYAQKYPWFLIAYVPLEQVNNYKNIQSFLVNLYLQIKLGKSSKLIKKYISPTENAIRQLDTGYLDLK